ncbi:cobyric acid synthase [Piscinibacter sp.]|uniref:cobyric acid synthase n=1 Tax=Piscinibacter sp. TaxID=1903157 RepID=UPI002F3E2B0B
MTARALMVLGTTSGAGKSWLATALCRWLARQGLKVAPFKAQNMSNNARVVPGLAGGLGEIGSAQYFQALAARVAPEVRMNPVLLKPERDTASQVVVLGEVRADLAQLPWRERSERLWPFAREALHGLMAEHDVVVIEGAGSPAEINLHASDYVNMRTAREANAACLLVTDIDRGGAFAHLYGTHQLLPAAERALLRGFVLNRFRGDAGLLAPGPEQLRALTGVPTLAVLPLWRGHGLPEEDGVFDDAPSGPADGLRIAVVTYPRISNLDEFQPLRAMPGVRLRWARSVAELDGADWIVLPGSKHTSGDLAWLRAQGMAAAIERHAAAGGAVLGICGGLQMLGEALVDPQGVDAGEPATLPGLELLPLVTHFEPPKLLRCTRARFGAVGGAWAALSGVGFDGYEIRHGRSSGAADVALHNAEGEPIGWQRGSVLGLYAHGLFESDAALHALFGASVRTLDSVFDGLADFIDARFEPGSLLRLIARQGPSR